MKLILDFDGVLFDSLKLKETFFTVLGRHGMLDIEEQYHFERANERPFSLVLFIKRLCKKKGMSELEAEAIYGEIMDSCRNFRNEPLALLLGRVGRENCYIVTNGEEEFQKDKIARTGLKELVDKVIVVPGTKKFAIERLCDMFPGEPIIFVDDEEIFFEDLDMEKCKNLTTVLYDKDGLQKIEKAIEESR